MPALKLHHHPLSGHVHRVELMLHLLGLPFETCPVDLARGEHRSPAFLALNPFGQVPVLEDGDLVLADSNAILVYLALRYAPEAGWWPRDPVGAARVQRWLSVAAGQLAAGPAAARVAVLFGRPRDERSIEVAERLLGLMDAELAGRDWLAGPGHPTLADVALYSYTAHAPEGGVSLQPHAHVQAWLARVEALPGFVGMRRSPTLA